jgi:hypothetical protein
MIRWDDELWLLSEQELDELPDGTRLLSINNKILTKNTDLDRDTRFGYVSYKDTKYGYVAYGLTEELIKSQNLEDRVLLWRIRG